MEQKNGAELLGVNDPRSASIGIISVSPDDDRRSVLAAILTQEKLGRKQIAIVLPSQGANKAFQRPSDFDDLKTIRRNLEAQIVFIAPGGSGPAEFARQRRFAVYSTLESYGRALRDGDESGGVKKGGWLFHRGKPKFMGSTPAIASAPPQASMPNTPATNEEDDDDKDVHTDPLKSAGTGMAALGAGMIAADMFKRGSTEDDHTRLFPIHHEDDWDALPPSSTGQAQGSHLTSAPPLAPPGPSDIVEPTTTPPGKVPSQDDAGQGPHPILPPTGPTGGPGIIDLKPVRRVTVKLPPSDLTSSGAANQPPMPPANANMAAKANRSRNTGKMAAAAMFGAGIGAANMAAGPGAQRIGGVGHFPPPQPPRPGGSSGSGRGPRPRRTLVALIVAIILVLLIAGGATAFMNPNMFRQVSSAFSATSGTTVTITPDSKLISNNYVIQGVPGTPNSAQRQIAVRSLSATAKSDPKTVNATGHTQTPGTVARGQLTFLNGSFSNSYTVGTNTPIPAGNVSLFLDVPAVIPHGSLSSGTAGTVTVSAHAAVPGAAGNISAHAADQICCNATGNVSVKNSSAFTGGQDPQDYHFVQQSDVDGVANPLKNTVSAQAQKSLNEQLHTGEQLVAQNGALCPSSVNTDNPIGPHGVNVNSVTVTVTATCKALAYDRAALQTMVANLLASKANNDIGSTYKLVGQIVMHTTVQNIDQQGNVSLLVSAKGIWAAQISDAEKTALAQAIAGKTVAEAQRILAGHKDIGHADIQVNGGNVLPSDPNQIKIVIQNVPGVQDTATPTPGGPGSSTPVNSPGGTLTPLPGNG